VKCEVGMGSDGKLWGVGLTPGRCNESPIYNFGKLL